MEQIQSQTILTNNYLNHQICCFIDGHGKVCNKHVNNQDTVCENHSKIMTQIDNYRCWLFAKRFLKDHIYCKTHMSHGSYIHIFIKKNYWDKLQLSKGYTNPEQINQFDEGTIEIDCEDIMWDYIKLDGTIIFNENQYPEDYGKQLIVRAYC